jgi:APA family basic amino acid/polyamine antiporter
MVKTVAVATIVLLTAVNYVGVKPGSLVLNFFTVLKVLALCVLIAAGLFAVSQADVDFTRVVSDEHPFDLSWLSTFLFALVAALFTYGGWQNIGFIAGELKNPRRNLPLSLFVGCFIIILIYVLTNFVYARVLSVQGMSGATLVAADTMQGLWGDPGGIFISLMIMTSSFGITNAIILVSPRVYYAMAKDGLFFRKLAAVHPRYNTPGPALVLQAVWSCCIVVVSDTFQQIMNYVVFMDWLFLALAVTCVYILRRKYPDAPRPYKVWGYPVTPAVFIVLSAVVVINTFARAPLESTIGTAIVLSGAPAYMFWRRKNRQ